MDFRDDFLERQRARGLAAGTMSYQALYLGYFLSFLTRRRIEDVREVTPQVLDDYRAEVLGGRSRGTGAPLATQTIAVRLSIVREYFQFLIKRKHILMDPAAHIELPKLPDRLPKALLDEPQIKAILERPDMETLTGLRDRAILELLYSTAVRRQELVSLDVFDLDLGRGELRVNKGKGRKDRVVPVGKTAAHFVGLYVKRGRPRSLHRLRRGRPIRTSDPALFLSQYGRRMTCGALQWIIAHYVGDVFPGQRMSAHAFRHACATHMVRGGANIRLVQEMLGHSRLETTTIYTRVCPVDLKEAHRRHHPANKRADQFHSC